MVEEVTKYLAPSKGKKYIDATVGSGGHSLVIIRKGAYVLGIDVDPDLLVIAEQRLTAICPEKDCFKLIRGNFREIDEIAKKEGLSQVDGILFDLGVSNIHLKDGVRGFSFENPEAKLDMRLDPVNQGVKAADLLTLLRKDQLRELFASTMDPGAALWLARRVITIREAKTIETVGDFLEITRGLRSKPGLNPATLPMLALRMAVNSELENLTEVLPKALGLLARGGRLVVISFHSGEDRVVKELFKEFEREGLVEVLIKDVIVPKEEEVRVNPRARSAKMRVLERK